jgi:dolichol-phosphate mannosyltransferase
MVNNKLELAVIIPVYNEEEIISTVLSEWYQKLKDLEINFEIHAYNDGSNDNSLKVMNKIAEKSERLVVHDKENSGHGPTILMGYRENSHAEWVFQVDSDNEMSPQEFYKVWEIRNQTDFVIGKRDGRESPPTRKIMSRVSRTIVSLFYSNKVYDVNAPYRLMRTSIFMEYWKRIPKNTFAPNVIVSGIAGLINCRITELPIKHINRATGEVSIQKIKLLRVAIKSLFQTVITRFLIAK